MVVGFSQENGAWLVAVLITGSERAGGFLLSSRLTERS